MRPCWATSLAADPPPSTGHAGEPCLPVPACPCCPSLAAPVPSVHSKGCSPIGVGGLR